MFYIYKITNNLNGKSYIGQTENMTSRIKQHITRYQEMIDKDITVFGIDNFLIKIIDETHTRSNAQALEELYITVFETYGFYNKSYYQGCYKRKNDRYVRNYKNSKKRRFNSMTCRYEKRKTKKTYKDKKEPNSISNQGPNSISNQGPNSISNQGPNSISNQGKKEL